MLFHAFPSCITAEATLDVFFVRSIFSIILNDVLFLLIFFLHTALDEIKINFYYKRNLNEISLLSSETLGGVKYENEMSPLDGL